MAEADGAAEHRRRGAVAAEAQDLVALADVLAGQVEDPRRGHAGLAAQHVPLAARDERDLAGAERARGIARFQVHRPRGHDVEPEVAGERRKLEPPRRAELGAAVEGAVHAEQVQRLAERIGDRRRDRTVHVDDPTARPRYLDDRAWMLVARSWRIRSAPRRLDAMHFTEPILVIGGTGELAPPIGEVLDGRNASVTDGVQQVLGRAPRD